MEHTPQEEAGAIELVIEGRPRPVGTLTVARLLPSPRRRHVGPFVFVDHMGPTDIPAGVGFDVPPHPHIGLSTVTYLFVGENVHRDSLGTVQTNRAGDLNLMTAGQGVVHSERADPAWRARGGPLHGVQLWLGLPVEREDDAPSFEHHARDTLPRLTPGPATRAQVILGAAFGCESPVAHPSRPLLVALELGPGARLVVPCLTTERALLVLTGAVAVDGRPVTANQLVLLRADATPTVTADVASRALLLGGEPLPGGRYIDWNFVSSSQDKIQRARQRWQERQFPTIPGDDRELVPLPAPGHVPERPGKL